MAFTVDYRGYEGNQSGFIEAILENNFIPYATPVGRELFGIDAFQDYQEGAFSIRDLFEIPGVQGLPSVVYFKNLNKDTADLNEIKIQLVNLQNDLKNNIGSEGIEYNDELIKFYGTVGTDVGDITGKVKESTNLTQTSDINFSDQIQTTLSEEAVAFFGPQVEQTYAFDDETGLAGLSRVLTLGGNYYNSEGQYVTKDGEVRLGPNGEPLEAPFLQNDGWNLFWERDDIFEIQQLIVAAGGPAPEKLGVWDKGLAKYMNNVLAYANDGESWMTDMQNGLSTGNQWRSALQEFKLQNDGGTQLSEILTAVGYSTVNRPKVTGTQAKSKVDEIYAGLGLKATAKDYKEIGDAFIELSTQAAARQDEIESKAVGLQDLLLGTTKFMSSPPSGETPEGIEYQKALNDGRVLETSTGIYIIPDPEELAAAKDIPEAIDVDARLLEMVEARDATRIQGAKDREFDRNNALLFKQNFLTTTRTGLG